MTRRFCAYLVSATALGVLALPPLAFASSSWRVVPTPNVAGSNYDALDATLVTSPSQAWAAGFSRVGSNPFRALVERWNGTSWAIASSAPIAATDDTRFHALAAASSSDMWAVGEDTTAAGSQHGLIEHWNGSSWTRIASGATEPNPSGLQAVSADGPSDAWAVGWSRPAGSFTTLIERWNGRNWTVVNGAVGYPSSSFNRLLAVAALAANNVWVLGVTGRHPDPVIEHWNGSAWSIVAQPAHGYDAILYGISANSANDIWAVGTTDVTNTLIEHWDGARWSIVPSPSPSQSGTNSTLVSVDALGPSDVWAVGQSLALGAFRSPLTEHWDGTRWTIVTSPGSQANLNSVSGLPSGPLYAVGQQNSLTFAVSH
jgi:hypothetical protein